MFLNILSYPISLTCILLRGLLFQTDSLHELDTPAEKESHLVISTEILKLSPANLLHRGMDSVRSGLGHFSQLGVGSNGEESVSPELHGLTTKEG